MIGSGRRLSLQVDGRINRRTGAEGMPNEGGRVELLVRRKRVNAGPMVIVDRPFMRVTTGQGQACEHFARGCDGTHRTGQSVPINGMRQSPVRGNRLAHPVGRGFDVHHPTALFGDELRPEDVGQREVRPPDTPSLGQ